MLSVPLVLIEESIRNDCLNGTQKDTLQAVFRTNTTFFTVTYSTHKPVLSCNVTQGEAGHLRDERKLISEFLATLELK